jgi:hypothetical protein
MFHVMRLMQAQAFRVLRLFLTASMTQTTAATSEVAV